MHPTARSYVPTYIRNFSDQEQGIMSANAVFFHVNRVMSTGVVSLHLPSGIKLQDDARARSRAVASNILPAGSVVLSDSCLAAALLPSEKGRRCDACYRMSKDKALRKCSGCASYWYCDTDCTSRGQESG
jgi:hypothetical protein